MIAKSTFKGTDYSLPVIGTPNSVSSFTRQSLIDFYNKWYVSKKYDTHRYRWWQPKVK